MVETSPPWLSSCSPAASRCWCGSHHHWQTGTSPAHVTLKSHLRAAHGCTICTADGRTRISNKNIEMPWNLASHVPYDRLHVFCDICHVPFKDAFVCFVASSKGAELGATSSLSSASFILSVAKDQRRSASRSTSMTARLRLKS